VRHRGHGCCRRTGSRERWREVADSRTRPLRPSGSDLLLFCRIRNPDPAGAILRFDPVTREYDSIGVAPPSLISGRCRSGTVRGAENAEEGIA